MGQSIVRFSILLLWSVVTIVQCGQQQYGPFPLDQDAISSSSTSIKVEQPLTYGAALQAEVQRLQRLTEDVFPPMNDSYFTAYGDRTIVSLQFPSFTEEDVIRTNINTDLGGGPLGSEYGAPIYGPPSHKKNKKNKKHLRKAKDFGVITSQNYVYRRNVRDYGGFTKIFENSRPSQDILMDVGKLLAVQRKNKKSSPSSTPGGTSNLANLLKKLSPGWAPPPTNPGWRWETKKQPPKQSFALVAIETRVKVSETEPREQSLTNGSLIFPSPGNPNILTFVPFILRSPGDIESVFNGYEDDMKGLVPQERRDLISFLKLTEGIHADACLDGKERLHRIRRLSDSLMRLRLPKSQLFLDDPLEGEEILARETLWLYSSTVALRTLSAPEEDVVEVVKLLYPVVPLVPVVDYGVVPVVPVVGLHGESYGDIPPPLPLPPLPLYGEDPSQHLYDEHHGAYADHGVSAIKLPQSSGSGSSSSSRSTSYFYRTIKNRQTKQ